MAEKNITWPKKKEQLWLLSQRTEVQLVLGPKPFQRECRMWPVPAPAAGAQRVNAGLNQSKGLVLTKVTFSSLSLQDHTTG